MPRRRIVEDEDSDEPQSDMDLDVEDGTPEVNNEEPEIVVDAAEEDSDEDEKDEDAEDEPEEEEEDQVDATSDLDVLSSPPPEKQEGDEDDEVVEEEEMVPAPQPRLKITLKLPPRDSAASSSVPTGLSTPDESALSSRRGGYRDVDIESEDSDDADAQSTRSTSVATTGTTGRALTARQAVLANVVDSSHVSLLEPPNPRKKKPLTDIEMALKREETARKRRNLSEKKLEDEKAETINRLLKKQSRAKGKRNALSTADDRPTLTGSGSTPVLDFDAEDTGDISLTPIPIIPTTYRWISSSRVQTHGKGNEHGSEVPEARSMTLSFSVPVSALPQAENTGDAMEIDRTEEQRRNARPSGCDVPGCNEKRKYRLVKDWKRGACGMAHLKVLEAQS